MAEVLFRGISYPFRFNSAGGVSTSADDQHIKESVEQILLTLAGSLPHKPTFGSEIRWRIFDPTNAGALLKRDAKVALDRWEPRIEDVQVRLINPQMVAVGQVEIRVNYRIRGRAELQDLLITQGI